MSYAAEARSAAMTAVRTARLASVLQLQVYGSYIPTKVPVEATRNALNGTVRARKEAYLLLAAATPTAPIAVPMTPPIDPPLIVALLRYQQFAF